MTESKKRSIEETVVGVEEPVIKKPNLWNKGTASIKEEYLVKEVSEGIQRIIYDDDEVEESRTGRGEEVQGNGKGKKVKRKGKNRGQNHKRELIQGHEIIRLCGSVADPMDQSHACSYGAANCKFSHDVEGYLAQKPEDIPGKCPVWEEFGYCPAGLKCRWLGSHYDREKKCLIYREDYERKPENGELNWASGSDKNLLQKRKIPLDKSDQIAEWLDSNYKGRTPEEIREMAKAHSAGYVEPPFKVSEKKDLHFSGAKIVAPLTTVGNLPFRRLMRSLGADVTYSEMALCLPLIQGSKSEWALMKAHSSEYPGFGVQLAASKHWQTSKAVEAVAKLAPNVSEFNLNCGCPIDLLYRRGEGSAMMENPSRMIRVLKGMNYCSGETPVTVKLRMGIRDDKPLAEQLVEKLLAEGDVGAITVHGRSRKQRYTKEANWDYIGKVGKIVKDWNESQEEDKDASDRPPVYLLGNGDIYSYEDYNRAVGMEGVDSVMVGRGALIKPWIFEEIKAQQYIDKSASERLDIIERYAKNALDHWGSDEFGVNTARRYMCEFLCFSYRYVPVGILERLPPKLNERPPPWRGRNDLESLLGSPDYKDWIKITEMFLGKASDGFSFIPKHKSNSYEN
ncbi:DEKNAAC100951 [Brettanomyces naardenensis]|uniref:tRNA-dihydrouridine(47) synthase [NAD(P)(+)] n=1 Tax=Brettanomyces naardenensis TaxID=13370 RepID=A0A448YH20_BRENA|nr:DEKNAAC100951 [Brettanomyces naardenensis]